jgi:hypothetical protein
MILALAGQLAMTFRDFVKDDGRCKQFEILTAFHPPFTRKFLIRRDERAVTTQPADEIAHHRGLQIDATLSCAAAADCGGSYSAARSTKDLRHDPQVAREGYQAMMRGKRVVITGMVNKLLAQSVWISPRRLVTKIAKSLQEPVS